MQLKAVSIALFIWFPWQLCHVIGFIQFFLLFALVSINVCTFIYVVPRTIHPPPLSGHLALPACSSTSSSIGMERDQVKSTLQTHWPKLNYPAKWYRNKLIPNDIVRKQKLDFNQITQGKLFHLLQQPNLIHTEIKKKNFYIVSELLFVFLASRARERKRESFILLE